MDIEDFNIEFDESEIEEAAKRLEQKLAEDEKPVEDDDDCEACKI